MQVYISDNGELVVEPESPTEKKVLKLIFDSIPDEKFVNRFALTAGFAAVEWEW
jgi:hypothetical protein